MHIVRTHMLHFHAPLTVVFPLFTPLEEKKWVPGWDAEILYSETEAARETGCIFRTSHPGMSDTLWVLLRYDEAARTIQYVRFAVGHHIGMIEIQAEEKTRVQVTYTLTSLSAAGEAYLMHEFSEAQYGLRMQHWQHDIEAYLKTLDRSM